jgi:hypothetical protein
MLEGGGGVARGAKVVALLVVVFVLEALDNFIVHGVQFTLTGTAYGLVTAAAVAIFLAWLVPKIHLGLASLGLLLWADIFAIEYLINQLEGLFFTTMYVGAPLLLMKSVVFGAIVSGIVSAIAAYLLGQRGETQGIMASLKDHLSTRTNRLWILRIVAGSVVYYPIYFLFGLFVTPFVLPYYTNPSSGVVIPSFAVMVPLELFRGFLFVVVLLPLLAAVTGGRNLKFVALAAMLYIPGGFVTLVGNSLLPSGVIPFHATEILADSIVYGFVLSRLIGAGNKS